MRQMLGVAPAAAALPAVASRLAFPHHYATHSTARRDLLAATPSEWWAGEVSSFNVTRDRVWISLRRLAHSAHHRGQLTVYLRLLGRPVYSTCGPTADTGALFQNHAPTIYRYASRSRSAGESVREAEHT